MIKSIDSDQLRWKALVSPLQTSPQWIQLNIPSLRSSGDFSHIRQLRFATFMQRVRNFRAQFILLTMLCLVVLMAQTIRTKHTHPHQAFVILFWKSCKCPMVGLSDSYKKTMVGCKHRVQMPHPRTTPKLHFPVNKLQTPYLLKKLQYSDQNARVANRSKPLVISYYCKKDHIHIWLILMTEL